MADVAPVLFPGDTFTGHATGAVVGGRFVMVSANAQASGHYSVAECNAAGSEVGVAARDKAAGEKVMVYTEGVIPVELGAALAAGALVASNATGQAVAVGTGRPVGRVMADGAAGATAPVKLLGL